METSDTPEKVEVESKPDTEPPMSHVKQVLEEARKDLENAELPLGFIANPVRDNIVKPVLGVATAALPVVTGLLPFADELTAFGLSVPFDLMRFGYCIIHPDSIRSIEQDAHEAIRNFTDIEKLKGEIENDPDVRGIQADLLGIKGHIMGNTIEIISDPVSKLSEWNEATQRLAAYVENVGLGNGLRKEVLYNPRSDVNFRILGHVQAAFDNAFIRRQKTFLNKAPKLASLHEIARLMRYSTAAFGEEMIDAQRVFAGRDGSKHKPDTLVGSEALKAKVCDHVGIPTSCISYFCMGAGGSMKLLRHFISVDDDLEAVVLAIRGTGSFSGWVIDFQGMGRPFCNGIAHSGMADMADAILANSKDAILRALQSKPTYRLLVTGESLGGGVAPLVNLLCHNDKDLCKFDIRAHPFAGPPVYFQTSSNSKVDKAIENCTAYIHGDDVVAHCSVSAVQRLLAKLRAVDEVTKKMNVIDRRLIAAGRKVPTEALVNTVVSGDPDLPLLDGAPELYMPASSIIWFCRQTGEEEGREYGMMVCDAKKVATLGIPVTINMFSDHPPYVYETALNKVENAGWDIVTPPKFKDVGGSVAAFA